MNIGLDVGYSAVKAVAGERRVTFPSAVSTPDKARFSLNASASIMLVHPDHVHVGEGAVAQSRFLRQREDRRWIESDEWYSLFLAAVTEITSSFRRLMQSGDAMGVTRRGRGYGVTCLEGQYTMCRAITKKPGFCRPNQVDCCFRDTLRHYELARLSAIVAASCLARRMISSATVVASENTGSCQKPGSLHSADPDRLLGGFTRLATADPAENPFELLSLGP
jgi:hypothetical protein